MHASANNLTQARIHLGHLRHNLGLLQVLVGERPLWPAIKANAYGHGMAMVARQLVAWGYDTLCVAHVTEAMALIDAGIRARYLLLSATLPEHSEAIVRHRCEPVVCDLRMLEALGRTAARLAMPVAVHLAVDTGMGRIGLQPSQVSAFLARCRDFALVQVRGLMSHFPCADAPDKTLSLQQIEQFKGVMAASRAFDIPFRHMANSAAIFDLPTAHFDAVRPGIAMYGLRPSRGMQNPRLAELKPVLTWKTQITFLKEVPAGTGLSYGHAYYTPRASLIATLPVGYGDGLSRGLSNRCEMLVRGVRCPQVGRITMDQTLIDVTALRGQLKLGEEVIIIGRQGDAEITADELADKLDTINYEIVTAISQRVPRVLEEDPKNRS